MLLILKGIKIYFNKTLYFRILETMKIRIYAIVVELVYDLVGLLIMSL